MIKPILLRRKLISHSFLKLAFPLTFAGLGIWQLARLSEKEAIIAAFDEEMSKEPVLLRDVTELSDSEDSLWKKYVMKGTFRNEHVLVGPRTKNAGKVGFMAIQPFKIDSTDQTVLINRGWIPREKVNQAGEILRKKGEGQENILVCRNLGDTRKYYMVESKDNFRYPFYYVSDMSERLHSEKYLFDELDDGAGFQIPQRRDPKNLFSIPNRHLEYSITW